MKADYISHMGDDLTVVNAARVSFDKQSAWEQDVALGADNKPITRLSEKDAKLINYLATHGHWTPFSHPQITIRETVPIFVARQRFKHMIGFAYNEVSRRYVDDDPEFFQPDTWRSRPDASIKQGSGNMHPDTDCWQGQVNQFTTQACVLYRDMVREGVAPEQARMVLPQSMYTSYWVTGSLAAWARAYKQRIDPHAQQEIRDLAEQWGEIIEPLYPVSWAALQK